MRLLIICLLSVIPTSAFAEEKPAISTTTVDMSGTWSGGWLSFSNGHKGPLSGTFTKVDENTYNAKFRGRFFAVIPFRYNVNLNVVGSDADHLYLSGSSRLPIFGTFNYSAVATPTDFQADYTSKRDRGQFNLRRR